MNKKEKKIVLELQTKTSDAIKKIKEYTENTNQLIEKNKELKKQLQTGGIDHKKYREEIAENNKTIKANKEAITALGKEIDTNNRTVRMLASSAQDLRKELDTVTTSFNSLSESEQNSAKGTEMLDKMTQLTERLGEVEDAVADFEKSVDSYEEKILSALGINDNFAKSLFDMSKEEGGLKGFFSNISTSVQAFGKALTGLMANPVFLAIAGIAGAVKAFKFWYDYNEGLVKASKLTTQLTQKMGDDMRLFRSEVQGTADTFGKKFDDVLEASSEVANRFGISHDAAMKLVQDGFIAGADENDKFLETLKTSSEEFTNAGFSAEEFISIISQTADNGFFSENGFTAIKTAGEKIDEMSEKTRDALKGIGIDGDKVRADLLSGAITSTEVIKQVSTKLGQLPVDSKEAEIAIAEVFGESGQEAGRQYIETLKDIDGNLDSNKTKAGELGEIQERQMNAQIELDTIMAAAFDQTGGAFEKMSANAKLFIDEGLVKIAKGFIDVINWTIELYNKSGLVRTQVQWLIFSFKTLWTGLKTGFSMTLNSLAAIANVLKAIATLDIDELGKAAKGWFTNTVKLAEDAGNDVKESFENALHETVNPSKIEKLKTPDQIDSGRNNKNINKDDQAEFLKKQREARERVRKEAEEAARIKAAKEQSNLKAANAESSKIIDDAREQQRKDTQAEYDKRITELRDRLATENELTEEARKELSDAITKLEEEKNNDLNRLSKEQFDKEADALAKQITTAVEASKNKNDQVLDETIKGQEANQVAMASFNGGSSRKAFAAGFAGAINTNGGEKGQEDIQAKLEAKRAELDAITQLETESDAQFLERKKNLENEVINLNDASLQQKIEGLRIEKLVNEELFGSVSDMMEELGANNEAIAAYAKMQTLYDIGLNTAKAISSGVASAQSIPFPGNLLAVATTITTIMTNISKAKKLLSSEKAPKAPKFATGGLVTGTGSGTSDSITAQLSNGESVITALGTQMFGPMLSAFNQIGGGAPIPLNSGAQQLQGKDMLAEAFKEAMKSMPNPVVSIQEINNTNKRVEVLESYGVL